MRGRTRRQAHTGATEQFAALRRLQAAPVLREVVAGLGRISRARRGRDPSQQEARAAPAIWLTRWARGARPSATLSLTCPAPPGRSSPCVAFCEASARPSAAAERERRRQRARRAQLTRDACLPALPCLAVRSSGRRPGQSTVLPEGFVVMCLHASGGQASEEWAGAWQNRRGRSRSERDEKR